MPNFGGSRLGFWNINSAPVGGQISITTEINVFGDSSGSMNAYLPYVEQGSTVTLRNKLLSFYNNNETIYNAKVRYTSSFTERTFEWLNVAPTDPTTTKVINIVFQDESSPYGADDYSWMYGQSSSLIYDLNLLKSTINAKPPGFYNLMVFAVPGFLDFWNFLLSVRNGTYTNSVNNMFAYQDIFRVAQYNGGFSNTGVANAIIDQLNLIGNYGIPRY